MTHEFRASEMCDMTLIRHYTYFDENRLSDDMRGYKRNINQASQDEEGDMHESEKLNSHYDKHK